MFCILQFGSAARKLLRSFREIPSIMIQKLGEISNQRHPINRERYSISAYARNSRVFDAIFATVALREVFPFQVRGWRSNWYSRIFSEARRDGRDGSAVDAGRKKREERAGIDVPLLLLYNGYSSQGVRKFQSDYQQYTGYPRTIAVHEQLTRWHPRFGMKQELGGGRGMENPATIRNNMSNCAIRNTCVNTRCSRKAAVVLLHRAKWYDYVATNNMKIEFPSIPSITPSHSRRSGLYYFENHLIKLFRYCPLHSSPYNGSIAQFTKLSLLLRER